MTTYNTYQEAKIANPESNIYQYLESSLEQVFTVSKVRDFGVENHPCNPADHCMTVEKFLDSGYFIEKGDLFLNEFGKVSKMQECDKKEPVTDSDKKRFILRAEALEEKKPRTKVEYEQLGFHKCHEAMFKHEVEEKLYRTSHDGFVVASMSDIVDNWQSGLYRRIETTMTEREAFIEAASEALPSFDKKTAPIWAGKLYDSGMFKLVK